MWWKLDLINNGKIFRYYYIKADNIDIAEDVAFDIAQYDRWQITAIEFDDIPAKELCKSYVLG